MSIKLLHRYVGLLLCLIMLTISLTGVILVWKKEYLWLTVDGARDTVNTQLLSTAIEAIETSYESDEVIFIQLHSEDLSIHKVFLAGRRYAWHDQHGRQIQIWSGNQRWEDFFLDLHHRFLLGNTIGLNIAGFGSLLLLPLIVFGLVLWWPRRNMISLGMAPRSLRRGALMQSHGNIGGVFALPIIILAITGVILVYPVESRTVLLGATGQGGAATIQNETYDASNGLPAWSELILIAGEKFPESEIRSVQPSSSKSAKRSVNLQQRDGWHRLGRTSLKFHENGELLIEDELAQPMAKRVFGFSYPLHTAKLGLLYRLLASIVGLAFALLCVFGFMSFLKRNAN